MHSYKKFGLTKLCQPGNDIKTYDIQSFVFKYDLEVFIPR